MDGSTSLHEQPGSFNCFDTVGQYHADLLASPLSHLHENLPSSPLPSSPPRLGVLDVVFFITTQFFNDVKRNIVQTMQINDVVEEKKTKKQKKLRKIPEHFLY